MMKVVAINGSPKKKGNTAHAIQLVANELEKEGIEVEVIQVGSQAYTGCTACGACAKNKDEKCTIKGDDLNKAIQKIKEADGILLGSPVYFADINGTMKSFLDRAFYVASANGKLFRHKVGASIVTVRRTGGTQALQTMNQYLQFSEMFMPSSNYWHILHGNTPGEVLKDEEGVQIARVLGKNMAFLLKAVHAKKDELPEGEPKVKMNLVR
ncbi:flavodoxin family protein [Carboxylicivirga linearis]|uniref:Flavodoxin family protein n=1 Tax=Carboxylicivirga linearis TaxID=1628157 RepID=A0ABS5JRP1_9BACT|nr:flavodoxin family protein [Carboxylicivirga linearis]MBS2097493.1 flavodoxin family protein [Carboxylicivirga linearis]